jgi:hypothetical protein
MGPRVRGDDGGVLILPVVPICRGSAALNLPPNQRHIPPCPVSLEGRLAIVTDARRDAVDADGAQGRSAPAADGEVVWS